MTLTSNASSCHLQVTLLDYLQIVNKLAIHIYHMTSNAYIPIFVNYIFNVVQDVSKAVDKAYER